MTSPALARASSGSNGHGHTHEKMDNPGAFDKRYPPLDETKRNWDERAFTVGIGGPVGRCASALQ